MVRGLEASRVFGQLLVFLLVSGLCWAAPTLSEHIRLLRESKDFRVRTQAALALGASAEASAVPPLCSALEDENRTVRIASATALGRLAKGGADCLGRRLPKETDDAVRTSIERALDQLGSAGEPRIDDKTRLYVAVDKLSGARQELGAQLRRSFVKAVSAGVAFAPVGETPSEGAKVLGRFTAAKGFSLACKLSEPDYAGGQQTLKLSVVVMSYPGKAILASFSQKGSVGGLSAPSPRAEQELLADLADAAMRKFLKMAPGLEE